MQVQYAAGFKNASFLKEQRLLVPLDLKKNLQICGIWIQFGRKILKMDWVLFFFFKQSCYVTDVTMMSDWVMKESAVDRTLMTQI